VKIFCADKVASGMLPKRLARSNKTDGGKTLIIAGTDGMFGAAVLCATAASRVGAGYVYLMTDSKKNSAKYSALRNPDFLTIDLKKLKQQVKNKSHSFSAIAIGPGLGQSTRAKKLVSTLLKSKFPQVVADADALNIIAKTKIKNFPKTWILTPHEGELGRLLGVTSGQIKKERRHFARLAQKKFGCIILLKGHKTLVASPDHLTEIHSGNAALAKAGTGDVLTGMIAGFLSQGLSAEDAAKLGAFIHGRIADEWMKNKDVLSLMPSDMNLMLPEVLRKIRNVSRRGIR
jgi:ADP-dependent NAD(P)H-hydrate dehydratase